MDILEFAVKMMTEVTGRGIDAERAAMAIDTTPEGVAPENHERQMLVAGIRNALTHLGHATSASGVVDTQLAQLLSSMIGPNWMYWSWRDIYTKLAGMMGLSIDASGDASTPTVGAKTTAGSQQATMTVNTPCMTASGTISLKSTPAAATSTPSSPLSVPAMPEPSDFWRKLGIGALIVGGCWLLFGEDKK